MNNEERIYNELRREAAAIWYISDENGSKIMVKAPTTCIKAVAKGCKIEFLFCRDESYKPNFFHTGLRIYDDLLYYQMIFCTHRFLYEHLSIAKILNIDRVQIQLFNEMSICQAFGDLIIKESDKHDILSLLGNPKKLYAGEFNKHVEKSLDNFQNIFEPPSLIVPESLHLIIAEGTIIKVQPVKNYIYHDEGVSVDINILGNEGEELEKEVFAVLYSLFDRNTIKNPRINYKTTNRELTDILTFSDIGIFLFETKALGVINAKEGRTMERKVSGLQKQISKAISQLAGAMKKISENVLVFDSDGKEIHFNRTLIPHGIVLISEFLPFGEWDSIVNEMFEAMLESNSMIHLLDMKEFMQFVGHAQSNKYIFDDFLIQRAAYLFKHRTLFQTSSFIDKPRDE